MAEPSANDSHDWPIEFDDDRSEAEQWCVEQFAAGLTSEQITQALITQDWTPEEAAELAEKARQQTRHLRGVVTREQVSALSEQNYRQGMNLSFRNGFVFLRLIRGLVSSFKSLRILKTLSKRNSPNKPA